MRQIGIYITGLALLSSLDAAALQGQRQVFQRMQPKVATRPLPYPVIPAPEFQRAIEEGTRTEMGRPGPNYWQQWTDYALEAKLVPEEKRIEGHAAVSYHNRSPDELPFVALHLFQNLHAEGAVRNERAEVTGGVELTHVAAAGEALEERTVFDLMGRTRMGGYAVDGTIMYLRPAQPIRPGESLQITVDWTFNVPQSGASGRMGWSAANLFHIAYWYRQLAVYDDVVGWQVDQFLGNAEFYVGYGSYDLTVVAPEGWVVMATGALLNPAEVLPDPILERYRLAQGSDSVVHVLTESDFGPGNATRSSRDGHLRWRFRSDTVRDVAFSAMRASLWDAARTTVGDRDGDGNAEYALINSFWRSSAPRWSQQWRYAQHSIDFLSRWTGFPYPWPHMTSIEGGGIIGGGMEFPMMTLMGTYNQGSDAGLYGVTAHELAHMWVPMIVGTDERRHSWMDEGTTSFNNSYAEDEFYPGVDHSQDNSEGYLFVARMGLEGEIMRWSDYHYSGQAYGTASYSKPAALLATLRGLLGAERFDSAYHEYIRTWAYKHPKPWDFFNHFASASGQDLDWFWRSWYHETWALDHAVGSVIVDQAGTTILIEDLGWAPMPARVTVTRQNGEIAKLEVPVLTWLGGATSAELKIPAGSPVVRVEIDAEMAFPDVDRGNNVWDRDQPPGR
jgi:hypothetical protein